MRLCVLSIIQAHAGLFVFYFSQMAEMSFLYCLLTFCSAVLKVDFSCDYSFGPDSMTWLFNINIQSSPVSSFLHWANKQMLLLPDTLNTSPSIIQQYQRGRNPFYEFNIRMNCFSLVWKKIVWPKTPASREPMDGKWKNCCCFLLWLSDSLAQQGRI